MADHPAENPTTTGTTLTERNGAAIATDTYPAGALIIARNTGAGTHTVLYTPGYTFDGLAVGNRTVSITAGQTKVIRLRGDAGDANGRVPVWVGEGTQSEVKITVVGA